MKTVAIIQARLHSARLPYKVLMGIHGKPMVGRVIERVKKATLIDEIVLATPDRLADRVVFSNIANDYKVKTYFGNEEDVLDRCYRTAAEFEADIVVRITSDCPLLDPKIIDACIDLFVNTKSSYVTNNDNLSGRSFPTGMDVEVFSYEALVESWNKTIELSEREHVTLYIRKHPELFRITKLSPEHDLSQYQWSVNTAEELEFVRWVYLRLGENFHLEDIVKLVEDK